MGNNSSTSNSSSIIGWFRLVVIFLLVCFLGDRALAKLAEITVLHSQIRFSRVYRGSMANAVLILGDSRAVNCCYAPALTQRLNARVFNFGYNGASPLIQEALLNDYLDRNAAPKLVILEVTNVGTEHQLLRALQPYVSSSERLDQLLLSHEPRLQTAGSLLHLVRFNNELSLRSLFYLGHDDQGWINQYQISADQIEATRNMSKVTLEAHPENLAALTRMVRVLQSRNVAVKLLVSPYFPLYRDKLDNFDGWLNEISRATGQAVEDFAGALQERRFFADRIHLNSQGGRALAEILVADGLFADLDQNR